MEPAHSCYGLSLYGFLGIVEYRQGSPYQAVTGKIYQEHKSIYYRLQTLRTLKRHAFMVS